MSTKFLLPESDLPDHWYNVVPDLPSPPPPPMGPDGKPVSLDALQAIFPPGLIEQEVSTERRIAIPEEVREIYRLWRPTPLHRAKRLEAALNTPARIYYKNESVSPAGSHKPNTSIPQAWYNKAAGIGRLVTETGAGQWGCSLALAGQLLGLAVRVYMVRVSYEQKPYRRSMMQTWGAEVFASPTRQTNAGRRILEQHPDTPGSLGIAISEAVEEAVGRDDTNYALGSVLNHVMLHQTVIGQEALRQMAMAGDFPDVVFGCCGGGSNFAGIAFPFFGEKAAGRDVRLVAVEPTSCPTLTKGVYAYDYGDATGLTPLLKMHTLGHDFVPPGIHAGGLRYHGAAPLVSQLVDAGLVEALAIPQLETFEAGVLFARTEGIVPAPESTHAIAAAIRAARECARSGEPKTLLFNLSGHGHFDMSAYDRYFAGDLQDYEYPTEAIEESLRRLPKIA
jgi:tryptophan synthase beta chain